MEDKSSHPSRRMSFPQEAEERCEYTASCSDSDPEARIDSWQPCAPDIYEDFGI